MPEVIHCKGGIGFGIRREIFFLNLEDGYFGCQVNQSTDVLQLYELSRLCDGYQDCFQGSDELARELKCTSKYLNTVLTIIQLDLMNDSDRFRHYCKENILVKH
ncbi:hypothetical protein V9T40_003209 [Parthenolecanium corni]|uniref:Uncharacterized protein n=1 Tax=Parthenolecanium corni TaxID=536013 RepID=A0AAN9TQ89_9HEMI